MNEELKTIIIQHLPEILILAINAGLLICTVLIVRIINPKSPSKQTPQYSLHIGAEEHTLDCQCEECKKTRVEFESDKVTYCSDCHSVTHTVDGACGKCGTPKYEFDYSNKERLCGECGSQRYVAEKVTFYTEGNAMEEILSGRDDKNGILVHCADCGTELNRITIK